MSTLHGITFESFGVIAELSSDDPDLLKQLPAALPAGWQTADHARSTVRFAAMRDGTVRRDGEVTVRTNGDFGALRLELTRLIRRHLVEHAPGLIFVHAGVVEVAGHAILIPGNSMSGKTTLAVQLVRAGATYYSDEFAVIDAEGLIHPFADPPSIRAHDRGLDLWSAEVRPGSHPIRAALVVVTEYQPGARWQPRPGDRGEGALALLEHTLAARSRPARALAAAHRAVADAAVLIGARGEAAETANELLRFSRELVGIGAASPTGSPANSFAPALHTRGVNQ